MTTEQKTCTKCQITKDIDLFHKRKSSCKSCMSIYSKKFRQENLEKLRAKDARYYSRTRENPRNIMMRLIKHARRRAKILDREFTISLHDLPSTLPDTCPILGIPLIVNKGGCASVNSPSLDRIDPNLGYVKGNVQIISFRANVLKNNATVEELEKIIAFMKSYQTESEVSNV